MASELTIISPTGAGRGSGTGADVVAPIPQVSGARGSESTATKDVYCVMRAYFKPKSVICCLLSLLWDTWA